MRTILIPARPDAAYIQVLVVRGTLAATLFSQLVVGRLAGVVLGFVHVVVLDCEGLCDHGSVVEALDNRPGEIRGNQEHDLSNAAKLAQILQYIIFGAHVGAFDIRGAQIYRDELTLGKRLTFIGSLMHLLNVGNLKKLQLTLIKFRKVHNVVFEAYCALHEINVRSLLFMCV